MERAGRPGQPACLVVTRFYAGCGHIVRSMRCRRQEPFDDGLTPLCTQECVKEEPSPLVIWEDGWCEDAFFDLDPGSRHLRTDAFFDEIPEELADVRRRQYGMIVRAEGHPLTRGYTRAVAALCAEAEEIEERLSRELSETVRAGMDLHQFAEARMPTAQRLYWVGEGSQFENGLFTRVGLETLDEDHQECPICVYRFTQPPVMLPCGHSFHRTCIRQWLTTRGASRSCPACRQPYNVQILPFIISRFLNRH